MKRIKTKWTNAELLKMAGVTDSISGPRCRCDAHVMTNGTCSLCAVMASRCRCVSIKEKDNDD